MRRFLQDNRWATVLVAGLLLFATSGLSLTRMTCLMGGHSVLSMGFTVDCCPGEAEAHGAQLSATCCALTQAVLVDVHLLPASDVDLDFLLIACSSIWSVEFAIDPSRPLHWLESRPPPLALMERLAVIGTRLV
ncbi:MAG: hypothetical protein IPL52_13850 [Flavobacteriales bacterium]|nr:hypothetical protein [Flavobacteriales bacterium]